MIRTGEFLTLILKGYQSRLLQVRVPYCSTWCNSLAQLLRAGLPLREALMILRVDGDKPVQRLVNTSLHAVDTGVPLSRALALYVPPLLTKLLQLAEATGDLPARLLRYAVQNEQKRVWREKLLKALSYPVILMCMTIALLLFVSSQILPMFIRMDVQFGTRVDEKSVLIERGLRLAPYGLLFIIGGCVLLCGRVYYQLVRLGIIRPPAKRYVLIREWLLVIQTSQISGQLGILLESGVPIIEALEQMCSSSRHVWQKTMYQNVLTMLGQGTSLSGALEQYLTLTATYMLRIAEETGEMGDTLLRIEEYARQRVQFLMERLLRWIEPLLLSGMGLIVLLTMYAVFMPMYDFISSLQPK